MRQYVKKDGSCSDCNSHEVTLDTDRTKCLLKQCHARDYVTSEGKCEKCDDYMKVSDDKKSCEDPKCVSGDPKKDGTCPYCPAYTFYSKHI
jgi:hypothetical protein